MSMGPLFPVFNLQLTGLVSTGSPQNVSMNIALLTGKSLNTLCKSPQLTLYPSFRTSLWNNTDIETYAHFTEWKGTQQK